MNKILLLLAIFLISDSVLPQVNQEWVQRFGSAPGVYNTAGIKVDNSGNVFVSGSVSGSTLTDYVTIKYNSSGVEQWSRIYTGLIEDRAIDMALDNAGNICVTGLSENQTGTYDIITIKYNTNGDSLWVRRYNGATATTMDQPVAMTIDGSNNIYVCGYSFGTSPTTFVTIKYSPSGDSLWISRFLIGGTTLPRDIYVDISGNVYVYGRNTTVLKYDSNGNLLWNKSYQFDAAESNKVLTGDSFGNIYFAATVWTSTFDDFVSAKINSNGDTLWTRTHNGFGSLSATHDNPSSIAIDNAGNVYTTGEIYMTSAYYFSTIRYNADGVFQWEKIYTNPQNGGGGNDVVTDNSGGVYVTGGSSDFVTIKYNSNGDSLWGINYNGPSNMNDIPDHIAIDNAGNLFLTGRSRQAGTPDFYQIATIKYSQTLTSISSNNSSAENYELFQNYPNPFNPKTNISYFIPQNQKGQTSNVKLTVYNSIGEEISILVNELKSPGKYSLEFDALNYPSGVYFYKLQIESGAEIFSDVKRMMVIK